MAEAGPAPRARARGRTPASLGAALPLAPFLVYVAIFLVAPTLVVVVGAFRDGDGAITMDNISGLVEPSAVQRLWNSVVVSAVTAVLGGLAGAVLAWLVVSLPATSTVRRATLSVAGVFAQFGGVTLAFAFIATLAQQGVVTQALRDSAGVDIYGSGWLYDIPGIMLVYLYFQIPLMVIVFVPALEGLRPQWREAAVSLGASRWQYLTQVAFPLLTPAFLGSLLLLFANAFAAYATAAALVSQGSPILPLFIRNALTSEVVLGRQNLAFALALEMIVVVAIVMGLYALLLRRTSRWLQ